MREVSSRSIFQPLLMTSIEGNIFHAHVRNRLVLVSAPASKKTELVHRTDRLVPIRRVHFCIRSGASPCSAFWAAVNLRGLSTNRAQLNTSIDSTTDTFTYSELVSQHIRSGLGVTFFEFSPPQTQASEQTLSGRLLFLPRQSIFPQSWQALRQKVRPPFPLQSWEPHLQQCRVRFWDGSRIATSDVFSPYPNGLFSPF